MKTNEFDLDKKAAVEDIHRKICTTFSTFSLNAEKVVNKSAAIRARKATMELTRLMKIYRSLSIK